MWSLYYNKKGGVKEVKEVMQQLSHDDLYEVSDK